MIKTKYILSVLVLVISFMLSCKKDVEITTPSKPTVYKQPTPYFLQIPDGLKNLYLYIPIDNPLTVEGIKLGRYLFYDSLLSDDYTISCGSCHQQKNGFGDAPEQFSNGVRNQIGNRNSMNVFNLVFQKGALFWDGREPTLEKQILQPVLNPVEMHQTWQEAVSRISKRKEYMDLYTTVFQTDVVTKENIAKAIAQFLRTIVSGNSKFDKGTANLTLEEKTGMTLFLAQPTFTDSRSGNRDIGTGIDCSHCHVPPLFQPEANLASFMNNGMDTGRFRVPSLRNVMVTPPYMHDGSIADISAVLKHYNDIKVTTHLDPNMWIIRHAAQSPYPIKLNITTQEVKQVMAFLSTLTDDSLMVKKEYSNPFR